MTCHLFAGSGIILSLHRIGCCENIKLFQGVAGQWQDQKENMSEKNTCAP